MKISKISCSKQRSYFNLENSTLSRSNSQAVHVCDDHRLCYDLRFHVTIIIPIWSRKILHLCRTMACFHLISISLISSVACFHLISISLITPVLTTFLWILPLCALLLHSMTHYDITMGHDVVRDAPLWHNNG